MLLEFEKKRNITKYPLAISQFTIEHGPFSSLIYIPMKKIVIFYSSVSHYHIEIVDLPIKKWEDFPVREPLTLTRG